MQAIVNKIRLKQTGTGAHINKCAQSIKIQKKSMHIITLSAKQ